MAQTDAPDDLIAELARLMADDARPAEPARPEQPGASKPAPVRIPGGDTPSPAAPTPRFDFSASGDATARREPVPVTSPQPTPAAPAAPADAMRFDFDLGGKAAGPATPIAVQPAPAREKETVVANEPAPELDHDSLADLIAAELANDMAPAPQPQPFPETKGPPKAPDNFGVPPVFGLGAVQKAEPTPVPAHQPAPVPPAATLRPAVATPAPVQPKVEPRVEGRTAVAPAPSADIQRPAAAAVPPRKEESRQPSPALRSLATPTIPVAPEPKPQASRQTEGRTASVDDAILAAAAASGARVEWVDSEFSDARDAGAVPGPRRKLPAFRLSRAVAGPLVAVGLLGVAGAGLWWVLGQGGAPSGPAPLIVADTTPIKETPEPQTEPTPQSVVFNEISGAQPPADEQIVSRDQADEEIVTQEAAAGGNVISSGDEASTGANAEGLVNRRVRTVTVRPDGTIVRGEDSLAGSAILPVDRPNVPAVAGADSSTPELVANAEAAATAPTPDAVTTPIATPETEPTPDVAVVSPGSVVPVVDQAGTVLPGRTVTVPMQRPGDFQQIATAALSAASSTPAATSTQGTLPAAPAAATPTPAAASGGAAAAYVQLASQRTEEEPRQSAQAMATRFGVLFGGADLQIQRVDLAERGIYYRVLVPASSRDNANNICTNVRAAGGDCFLL